MYSHLENPNSCIRLIFFDLSAAFNTLQSHLLVDELLMMKIEERQPKSIGLNYSEHFNICDGIANANLLYGHKFSLCNL